MLVAAINYGLRASATNRRPVEERVGETCGQRLVRLDKLGGVVQVIQGGELVAGGVGIEAVLEVDGTEPVRARAQELGELIEYPAVRIAATVAGQSVEDNAAAPSVRGARPTRTRGQKSRSTRPPPLRW